MIAGIAANGGRDGADFEIFHRFDKDPRQLRQLAPAEIAAFERGLIGGVGHGELSKVAFLRLLINRLRPRRHRIDSIDRCTGGHRQQNLSNVDVGRGQEAALFGLKEIIQFLGADANSAHHLPLLYPHQDHFVADLFAHGADVRSLLLNCLQVIAGVHAGVAGDPSERLVEFGVGNANAGVVTHGQLQALRD